MYLVKPMSVEDLEFAVQITDTMDWGMVKEDFEFMMQLEPEGCFMLFSDSERVGIATTISFGKVGWFGNLIVDRAHRGKGAGSLLVTQSVKYLTGKNIKTVGLYAYMDKIPFYQRLGFKYDSDFNVLKGKGFSSPSTAPLREAKKEDVKTILDFDKLCFGASRRKLLELTLLDPNSLCYLSFEGGKLIGYVAAKVYGKIAYLGPLVCKPKHSDISIKLLKTIFNRLDDFEISMCLPEKEIEISDFLQKCGFKESFKVARMFYGPRIARDCIYISESLERG
jgi:N-acetylglutamate synthase-like GNAT family acetyltransferase